jgi:hypothetical protein
MLIELFDFFMSYPIITLYVILLIALICIIILDIIFWFGK